MPQRTKRYLSLAEKRGPRTVAHPLREAVELVKQMARDWETVELSARLGVDPRKPEQNIRGTTTLPHGTGKTPTVVVIAHEGDLIKVAEEAGADFAGGKELVEKIQKEGWLDFDVVIATPQMMAEVGKLGRILGPRGLMPNPKAGTVTNDVAHAVEEFKRGKLEFRVDRTGVVHVPVGKAGFEVDQLVENVRHLVQELMRVKPAALSRAGYLKSLYLSATQTPSVKVDLREFI